MAIEVGSNYYSSETLRKGPAERGIDMTALFLILTRDRNLLCQPLLLGKDLP
jgi:hypothetical protein